MLQPANSNAIEFTAFSLLGALNLTDNRPVAATDRDEEGTSLAVAVYDEASLRKLRACAWAHDERQVALVSFKGSISQHPQIVRDFLSLATNVEERVRIKDMLRRCASDFSDLTAPDSLRAACLQVLGSDYLESA